MRTKKFLSVAASFAAVTLLITSTPNASALWVPAGKAKVGDDCIRAGAKAPGRGADGTDLTCLVVTREP